MTNEPIRETLLKEIQQTDFVLQELNLFLDTHPNQKDALKMFEKYEKKSAELVEEYEKFFGSLTPKVNGNTESWQWICGPWPWEN